jgi:hypothetical protein
MRMRPVSRSTPSSAGSAKRSPAASGARTASRGVRHVAIGLKLAQEALQLDPRIALDAEGLGDVALGREAGIFGNPAAEVVFGREAGHGPAPIIPGARRLSRRSLATGQRK